MHKVVIIWWYIWWFAMQLAGFKLTSFEYYNTKLSNTMVWYIDNNNYCTSVSHNYRISWKFWGRKVSRQVVHIDIRKKLSWNPTCFLLNPYLNSAILNFHIKVLQTCKKPRNFSALKFHGIRHYGLLTTHDVWKVVSSSISLFDFTVHRTFSYCLESTCKNQVFK